MLPAKIVLPLTIWFPPLVSLLTIAQKYRSCTEQAVTESLESSIQLTSHIPTVSHLVFNRFCSLMSSVSSSSSALLHSVFIPCTQYIIYTFTGYNYTLGHEHCATYSTYDFHAASLIRHIRSSYGLKSPCEGVIFYVSCY